MAAVVIYSQYTSNIEHLTNYLTYAGDKLEAQCLVLTDGSRIAVDPEEQINLERHPDLESVEIRTKSGTEKMLTYEEYARRIYQGQETKKFTSAGYVKYIANREGVEKDSLGNGLFNMNGSVPTGTAAALAKELEGHRWWTPIVSIKREDALRTGFDNREVWESLIRSKIPEIARQYNISMRNLVFFAAYHDKEKNPHAHLFFTSRDPAEGFIKGGQEAMNQKTNRLKSMFFNEIFKDDVAFLKQDKNRNRQQLQQVLEQSLSRIMNREYIPSQGIVKQYEVVADMLHGSTGRKVYGYLPPEGKKQINELLRIILDTDSNVKSVYQETLRIQKRFLRQYMDDPEKIERHLQEYRECLLNPKKGGDTRLQNLIIAQVQAFCSMEPKGTVIKELDDIWEGQAPAGQKKRSVYPSAEAEWEARRLYQEGKRLYSQGDTGVAEIVWLQATRLGNPYAAYRVGKKYLADDHDGRSIRLGLELLSQAEDGFREIDDKAAYIMLAKTHHLYQTLSDEAMRELGLPKEHWKKREIHAASEILALWQAKAQGDGYAQARLQQLAFQPEIYHAMLTGTTEQEVSAFYCLDQIRHQPVRCYAAQTKEYKQARAILYGGSTIPDLKDAERRMKSEATAGNALAFYDLAVFLERTGKPEQSASYFREAYERFREITAARPDAFLFYRLGNLCFSGKGTAPNCQEAVQCWEQAASFGNDLAMYRLGKWYLDVEHRDMEKAMLYFRLSADRGNPYAAAMLENQKSFDSRRVIYANRHLMSKIAGLLASIGRQQSFSIVGPQPSGNHRFQYQKKQRSRYAYIRRRR